MARKKKMPQLDTNEFTTEEIGSAAYVLTLLLAEVQPIIDKASTYDILFGFLVGPMDEAGAKRAGKQIRKTTAGSAVTNATH